MWRSITMSILASFIITASCLQSVGAKTRTEGCWPFRTVEVPAHIPDEHKKSYAWDLCHGKSGTDPVSDVKIVSQSSDGTTLFACLVCDMTHLPPIAPEPKKKYPTPGRGDIDLDPQDR